MLSLLCSLLVLRLSLSDSLSVFVYRSFYPSTSHTQPNALLSAIKSICFLPSTICHLLTCVILSSSVCVCVCACECVYVGVYWCCCGCVLKRLSFWALTLGFCRFNSHCSRPPPAHVPFACF